MANKSLGPYTVLASREAYANRWIRVSEDQVIRPGGTHGSFGIVEMKPGSSVLALTATFDVYLVREFKYGIARDSIELISGAIEDGETPSDAAKRELLEEVGLLASSWVDLGVLDPFTTVVKSPNFMFLALGVTQQEVSPDEGEVFDVLRVSLSEAVGMVMRNEITHGASCVSVLCAMQRGHRVARSWNRLILDHSAWCHMHSNIVSFRDMFIPGELDASPAGWP